MSRSVAVFLPLTVVALAACTAPGDATVPAAASSGTPVAGEFHEPEDYAFAVTSSCGERAFIGDYRVVVAGGEVVAGQWRNPADGRWTPVEHLEWVPTFGDMLEEVQAASGSPEAGEVSLESDPADGHPTAISVDPLENAIDDEICYVITDYRPSG